ncbi:MAG: hypothetical protein OEY77_08525, partial [Nitrospira sp.]|nr:hypothetical protein [Nitrospira sp.]
MSDSDIQHGSKPTDPIITARIEAIKQLARGLSDRVAVMDHAFNIVYANEAAWTHCQAEPAPQRHAKCYEASAQRTY